MDSATGPDSGPSRQKYSSPLRRRKALFTPEELNGTTPSTNKSTGQTAETLEESPEGDDNEGSSGKRKKKKGRRSSIATDQAVYNFYFCH